MTLPRSIASLRLCRLPLAGRRAAVLMLAALLGVLAGGTTVWAQAPSLDPSKAPTQYLHDVWLVEDGLPQHTISAIAQTPDGYLWLGTEEGLVRYNGYRFDVYDHEALGSDGYAGIRSLAVDAAGTLWIGTQGAGLIRYHDGRFVPMLVDGVDLLETVTALHAGEDGSVWVGTWGDGVYRYQQDRFTTFGTSTDEPITDVVAALAVAADGAVWIGTPEGLLEYTPDGTRIARHTAADGLPASTVLALDVDTNGTLWVGTRTGAAQRTVRGGAWEAVDLGTGPLGIFSIWHEANGTTWFGTDGNGVARRTPDGRVATFASADGLQHDRVVALHQDREGSLWIGTEGGGLNRLRDGKFITWTAREGLPADMALTVYEDVEGSLWVGTEGGGVARIRDGEVTTYGLDDGLTSNVVLSLEGEPDGTLWIGTYGGGLHRLRDGRITALAEQDGYEGQAVFGLHRGVSGAVWAVTEAGLMHVVGDRVVRVPIDPAIPSRELSAVYEDQAGALWVGLAMQGVARYQDGAWTHFGPEAGLAEAMVTTFHQDAHGSLWVGTYGAGLHYFDGARFQALTVRDGLPSNAIYHVLEDETGAFWMSSNKGLFRVDRSALVARAMGERAEVEPHLFTASDGLRSRELNGGTQPAGWRGRDGRLWFPGIQGVAGIDPVAYRRSELPPPVVIEQVTSDDTMTEVNVAHTAAGGELPAGQRKITFTFAALTFIAPEQVVYEYRLDGYDETWTRAPEQHTATYTNLPPGDYTFRVRARNSDGVWNEAGATYAFSKAYHFYQRPSFWLLVILGLIGLIAAGYRLRVRHLKQQQRHLEGLVQARTADLQAAKDHIEAQAEQLRDLDRFKTQFFANISHEFRTPLTLMIGPLENALTGVYGTLGGQMEAQVHLMLRNGRRLLRLINQLLDLSKLESGKMTLHAKARQLVPFVEGITYSFTAFVEQKQVALRFDAPDQDLQVYFEPDKLEKIFFNLLSNAVKYTGEGGEIAVAIREAAPSVAFPEGAVEVSVSDTGEGIPAEHLPHVFDRFHRVDGSDTREHEGTGIGLALVRELVLLHGGDVRAESTVGEGTTFTVILPKGRAHLDEAALVEGDAPDEDSIGESETLVTEMASASFNALAGADMTGANVTAPELPDNAPLVLIVDDNADIRDYVRTCLHDTYRIAEASNGVEGLEQARKLLPDVILSDIMMPRMNGYELCRHAKADPELKHIPFVLLSAKASRDTVLEGLQEGADEYLPKPFNVRELRIRIQNLLRLREQERDLRQLTDRLQQKVQEQLETILTEREAYEEKLLAEKERAERAAALKSSILTNLSHEFRTPITGIIGWADILSMELEGQHEEAISYIQQSGHRLMDTLTVLLELADFETTASRPGALPTPLADVVASVVEERLEDAQEKGLQLTFQSDATPSVAVDPDLLRRVAHVLLDNALKFTPEGVVTVVVGEDGDERFLRVQDTGIGISEEFLPYAFEAFRQESDGLQRDYEGNGLGLTLAKRLVDVSNGRIEVDSTPGEGSTFTVYLPAPKARPVAPEAPARLA